MKYIKGTAWRIALKYKKGEEFVEDLIQEFYLALTDGQNTLIEHVAMSLLRKEIKRGITGKWDSDFSFSPTEALACVKQARKECSYEEFMAYIIDVMRPMNEFEQKFILLYIKGFSDFEVMEKIREIFKIGNDKFYREKKRLLGEIDHSGYEETFKRPMQYKQKSGATFFHAELNMFNK